MDAQQEALLARIAELEDAVQAAEGRWRERAVQGELALALQGAGCRDVEAALRLLDHSGVTVGEDGAVTGVTDAVAALQSVRGYLFAPRSQGGAINPAPGPTPGDPTEAFAGWLRGA